MVLANPNCLGSQIAEVVHHAPSATDTRHRVFPLSRGLATLLTWALRSLRLSAKQRVPLIPGTVSASFPGAMSSSEMPASWSSMHRLLMFYKASL